MKEKRKLPLRGLRPLDSGGIFLLAQISIVMIQVIFTIILGFFVNEGGIDINTNKWVSYALAFVTQTVIFVTPLIYCHFTGVNFVRELNPKRGISPVQGLLLVLIALLSVVAFTPLTNLFVDLLKLMGYEHELTLPSFVENFGILLLSIFFVAVVPAIGEETMYRGFVSRGLRKFGILSTFLLSALIFATAHGNLLQFVYQFILGLLLVTVYFATRSIYASMIVHMTSNATALIINYIAFKTTGSEIIDTGLRGAPYVFASLGVFLAGTIALCLVFWLFLRICKKRQDIYVARNYDKYHEGNSEHITLDNAREHVDITTMRVYGKHNKKGTNFITKYLDFLKYLNFSYEEEELERTFKIPEEIQLENATSEEDKGYCRELLNARLEKDRRWDRNMLALALLYNIFILVVNIINAVKG